MNQKRLPLLSLWLALALAILPALRAQETPPAPPATPEKPAIVEPAKPADEKSDIEKSEPAANEAPAPVAEEPKAEDAKTPAADAKPSDEPPMRDLTSPEKSSDPKPVQKKSKRTRSYGARNGDEPHFGSQSVPAGQEWRAAVSILGNTTVDGTVSDAAVSVVGDTTVNGKSQAAVSVLGTTRVNGHVSDAVVAVLGNVELGPEADVHDVVVVLGDLKRDPAAKIHGSVEHIGGFGPFEGFEWLSTWIHKCLFWARPLGFGAHLGWAWIAATCFLIFYALLALLFPRGIDRCVQTLEERPGGTVVAALLTALMTPILTVLLAITGVGLLIIPFLIVGLFAAGLFGKAAAFAWLGRRFTNLFGSPFAHACFAVIVGGVIAMLLYTIPVVGFLVFKIFAVLGMGMVVYSLALGMRSNRPAKPATAPVAPAATFRSAVAPMTTAPAATSPAPVTSAGFGAASAPTDVPPVQPATESVPPVFSASIAEAAPPFIAATLPRAGFWIRVAAAFLDFLMIGIALGVLSLMHRGPGMLFVTLATYSAVMWKLKGTTVGGIICGLKVVRLDDRPLDWGVAVVRALSAFLSFFCAGLGFIWVAFDDEKQSWHDKIAGTTIVRVPKGTSLL